LVGVAVKTTFAPLQILLLVAAIEIEGVASGLTVVTNVLEVALFGVAQVLLDVTITFTESILFNEVDTKVVAFPPVLFPFSFHW
jgi:hypothetical protein